VRTGNKIWKKELLAFRKMYSFAGRVLAKAVAYTVRQGAWPIIAVAI
jgi:hypothetical protein